MHFTTEGGCHKPPPENPKAAAVGGGDERPDLLVWLTTRLRFWIFCTLADEEAAS